jgi:hypothetical protein
VISNWESSPLLLYNEIGMKSVEIYDYDTIWGKLIILCVETMVADVAMRSASGISCLDMITADTRYRRQFDNSLSI